MLTLKRRLKAFNQYSSACCFQMEIHTGEKPYYWPAGWKRISRLLLYLANGPLDPDKISMSLMKIECRTLEFWFIWFILLKKKRYNIYINIWNQLDFYIVFYFIAKLQLVQWRQGYRECANTYRRESIEIALYCFWQRRQDIYSEIWNHQDSYIMYIYSTECVHILIDINATINP